MIAIIDYDAGNLKSVENALHYLGHECIVTREPAILMKADKVILPGVGAFEDAMNRLREYHLIDTIQDIVKSGKPFLGICLGMQLMFDFSEESVDGKGVVDGLHLLPGAIVRFEEKEGYKIPHIGWNSLEINPKSRLFHGIKEQSHVYFVHSYYLKADNLDDVAASSEYCNRIHAAVEKENLFGCQFHPEKSGIIGLSILNNFATL